MNKSNKKMTLKEIKELEQLEKEFQKILNKPSQPKKNKPQQLFPSKPNNISWSDYIEKLNQELENDLKKFEKSEKLKKKYEYYADVVFYKLYQEENKENKTKKIKRNWTVEEKNGVKYVVFKIVSYKINKKINKFMSGFLYAKSDKPDTDYVDLKKITLDSSLNYWSDKPNTLNLLKGYTEAIKIRNSYKVLKKQSNKAPNFKNIKYKNDLDNAIYSRYTNYKFNSEAKNFKDLIGIEYNDYLKKNFRPNCCFLTSIINNFYDRFEEKYNGVRRYKHSLTYDYLCSLLNLENKPDNIGASINDVMPFFEKFKLGLVVYDAFMKEVHKFEPDKKPKRYMVLKVMIKDNHIYRLNKNLKSLEQIDPLEKVIISNKFKLTNNEKVKYNNFIHITNDLNEMMKIAKFHNNFRNVITEINKGVKISNPIYLKFISDKQLNDILVDLVCNHKYVPKVFFNNYVYKLCLQIDFVYILIETSDITTQDEALTVFNNVEEYNLYHNENNKFNNNFLKQEYLSTHHEEVLKIEDEYKINPITGSFKTCKGDVLGLDINKAYSCALSKINVVPVFSYFDVYKKYNNEPLQKYNYYIIKVLDNDKRTKIIFNNKITRVFGFVLENLNINYEILYYRKPFKLEEVDFKTPVDELYNNDCLDSSIKKHIANKLTGLLEMKSNKCNECKIYNDYEQANYFKKIYGGEIIPMGITEDIKKIEWSYIDECEVETYETKTEVKFFILNIGKKQRLINGFQPIKDIIYCLNKLKLLEMYDKMVDLNIEVLGIKTDCLLYNGKYNNKLIKDNFNISNKLGDYKIETGKYTPDEIVYIKDNNLIEFIDFDKIEVKTFKNEYNTEEINKYLIDNKKVMIKSLYPGCGKSQSIKNLGVKTLFILPENKLCQDIINENNDLIDAITFSKLFGLYADDIELDKHKPFDLTDYKAVCFDEIAKHSPDRLKRISNFIINHTNLLIFGAGDYRQIAPINYNGTTNYLNDCLNILFPKQILLKEIKRIDNKEEQQTIKDMYDYIFETNKDKIDIVDLCQKFNIKTISNINKVNTINNLAYFNFRCDSISDFIHYNILKSNTKFYEGLKIVCRKYHKARGITLNTNYTYKIKQLKKGCAVIEDETQNMTYTIDYGLLNTHFIFPYCRTIDSSQGTSISENFTIFDLNLHYVTKEHIWVAITRARSLKNLQIFIHGKKEVERFKNARITQYYQMKIDNYKTQDKKAKRDFQDDNYIDVDFINKQMTKNNNKCSLCLKDIQIFVDNNNNVISDLTIDRIRNNEPHIKSNCQLCCLSCNVSKK